MAVAAAAAIAASPGRPQGDAFLHELIAHVPASQVHDGIARAATVPPGAVAAAVRRLGNGSKISAQDTVAYCLWQAAYHLDDFSEAMWQTVSGGGDRDTTCAIVGGIVALAGPELPATWLERREPLPEEISRWQ